ncbi:MAG: hypothetical protein JST40_07335 [Armatimonadetes bacterium]|nr:hypothetical protein [Armatimonadota bacterium]
MGALVWGLTVFMGILSGIVFYGIGFNKPFVRRQSAVVITTHILLILIWLFWAGISSASAPSYIVTPFYRVLIEDLVYLQVATILFGIVGAAVCANGADFKVPLAAQLAEGIFNLPVR